MAADTWRSRLRGDEGASTVELVLIAPILLFMSLLLVGFGLIVRAHGSLDGAARDAARAGALQRDYSSAVREAVRAARADATSVCVGGNVDVQPSGDWRAGGLFTVTVSCDVRGLASMGLKVTTRVSSTSTSPLDTYRRTS
ncbi:TadE/TadG family type IV pilus assembly protein [Kitasatospora sp. NPDC088548]|uniref:TadE/TadG family type IV pilus assembly protein n=1 Tax=Kitasatospora sp. NPDC088548 TaxID=3364075 RepID=UPI0037F2439E